MLAALALLLQSFIASWAVAAQPMQDAFGNVLCITSDDGGTPVDGHGTVPNCCAFGCGFVAAAILAPSGEGSTLAWRNRLAHISFAGEAFLQPAQSKHDPGNPRAPPLV